MNKPVPIRSQDNMSSRPNNSSRFDKVNSGYMFSDSEFVSEKASVFDGISQNLMTRLIQKMDTMDKSTHVQPLKA